MEHKIGTRTVVNQSNFSPRISANTKVKIGTLFGINFALGYDVRY